MDLNTETARKVFHALSDPNRLKVLTLLADGEKCVCDIAGAVDMKQSLLSFHLRVLREAGVLRSARVGRWVHYSIDPRAGELVSTFGSALKGAGEKAKVIHCC